MTLDAQIEALLFVRGEPVSLKKLEQLLEKSGAEIAEALERLEAKLADRGLKLVFNQKSVQLGTDPELTELIKKIRKEELERELGPASLETLSVVLYRAPITKKEIDYLRGVNCSYILRHLSTRGLIEKSQTGGGQKTDAEPDGYYQPTTELLSWLGLSRLEQLPEYDKFKAEINKLENQPEKNEE